MQSHTQAEQEQPALCSPALHVPCYGPGKLITGRGPGTGRKKQLIQVSDVSFRNSLAIGHLTMKF